jgi:hypothetical protein
MNVNDPLMDVDRDLQPVALDLILKFAFAYCGIITAPYPGASPTSVTFFGTFANEIGPSRSSPW